MGKTKKFIISFAVSAVIFSLAAVLLSFAFSSGRNNQWAGKDTITADPNGRTVNVLLAMSDYMPEKFSDYDPAYVKNVMGMTVSTPSNPPDSALSGYRKVFVERMVIVRIDTIYGKIAFVPIAGDTLVSFKGIQLKLGEIAGEWGIQSMVEKVHALTGLEINNFAVFTPETAAKAIDLF